MYANTIGLTYTRYTRPNQVPLHDQQAQSAKADSKQKGGQSGQATTTAEAVNLDKARGDPPKRKRGRTQVPQVALPVELSNQLNDLTDRLNIRVSSMRRTVEFQVDKSGRIPQIKMVDKLNQDELNRYELSQMLDLERSLYDMAGFRFSFNA